MASLLIKFFLPCTAAFYETVALVVAETMLLTSLLPTVAVTIERRLRKLTAVRTLSQLQLKPYLSSPQKI